MTALNKQALREAAVRAGGGKWIYIRTLSLSSAYITEETGATVINCTAGDVPAKCAGFLELANPATVLALLDELEKEKGYASTYEAEKWHYHGLAESEGERADRAEKALDAAEKRIAELEARTVTLPTPYPKGYGLVSDKYNFALEECADAIRAAGIGVKGE